MIKMHSSRYTSVAFDKLSQRRYANLRAASFSSVKCILKGTCSRQTSVAFDKLSQRRYANLRAASFSSVEWILKGTCSRYTSVAFGKLSQRRYTNLRAASFSSVRVNFGTKWRNLYREQRETLMEQNYFLYLSGFIFEPISAYTAKLSHQ